MLKRGLIGVVAVAGVLAALTGLMWAFQRSLIYLPAGGPLPPANEVLPGGRDVTLRTEDGLRLGAWYFPARGERAEPADTPTVLYAPGNGGNRAGRAQIAEELTAEGISVLLLDYRGYGGNEGSPSEDGLAKDARAAHDYLVDDLGVPPQRLFYFGESLGCGVLSGLARRHPPAGMLLRSPFVDLAEVASVHYPFLPVRTLLRDRYPVAADVATTTDVEMTVVYGSADSIVPGEQSRAVASAADATVVEVRDANHNDPELFAGKAVIAAMLDLVDRAGT